MASSGWRGGDPAVLQDDPVSFHLCDESLPVVQTIQAAVKQRKESIPKHAALAWVERLAPEPVAHAWVWGSYSFPPEAQAKYILIFISV